MCEGNSLLSISEKMNSIWVQGKDVKITISIDVDKFKVLDPAPPLRTST